MFCGNCGIENDDNAKCCRNCGKSLQTQEEMKGSEQFVNRIKALPKKLLISIGCGAIALIAIICLIINAGTTINLNKYITIETSGYEGYGRPNVVIDWNTIEEKYGDKIVYTEKAKEEFGGLLNLMTPMDSLQSSINIDLDKKSNLSNGEVITCTWNIDDSISDYVKCKLKYKDITYKVSGLNEVGSFDAFEGLTVSFEGIAPNGTVVIDYDNAALGRYDYTCEKTSGLRNGDTVKITISESNIENYATTLGMVPTELEKTYVVDGLDEYIESYSDLTEEFLNHAKSEAEDTIYAYIANSYNTNMTMAELTYAGYIMDYVKEDSGYAYSNNDLYIIYSGQVSSSNNDFQTTVVYYPVRFTNILNSQGTLSYSDKKGIVGSTYIANSWRYSTKGYVQPLNCYLDIVESNKTSYNFECGDGFEFYAGYEVVMNLEGVNAEYKESLQENAKQTIESYISSTYNGGSVASELTYVGEYFLKSKSEDMNLLNKNMYVLVFSATVSNSRKAFETTTVYFPVVYKGIAKLPGDEYVILECSGIKGSTYLPNSYYSTKGYVDGNKMYSDLITSNRESYTYEVSEGLGAFGN